METTKDLITDKAINIAWGNANFGEKLDKRTIIASALLKYACGYYTGHTIKCICSELGLRNDNGLTEIGKKYLYAHYSNGISM